MRGPLSFHSQTGQEISFKHVLITIRVYWGTVKLGKAGLCLLIISSLLICCSVILLILFNVCVFYLLNWLKASWGQGPCLLFASAYSFPTDSQSALPSLRKPPVSTERQKIQLAVLPPCRPLHYSSHVQGPFAFITTQWGGYFYPNSTDKEIEVQRVPGLTVSDWWTQD